MMTAKAPATRRLLLRATINVKASQLGGDSSTGGGSCQQSTTLSQGRLAPSKRLQQSLLKTPDPVIHYGISYSDACSPEDQV